MTRTPTIAGLADVDKTPHSEMLKPYEGEDYQDMEHFHPANRNPVPLLVNRPELSPSLRGTVTLDECPHLSISGNPIWVDCGMLHQFFGSEGEGPFEFFLLSGPGSINQFSGLYMAPLCSEIGCTASFLDNSVSVGMTDACRKRFAAERGREPTMSTVAFHIRPQESPETLVVSCPSCSSPVVNGDQVVVSGGQGPYTYEITKGTISDTGVIGGVIGECGTAIITVTDAECLQGILDVRMPGGSWVLASSVTYGTCAHDVAHDVICISGGTRRVFQMNVYEEAGPGPMCPGGVNVSCPEDCSEKGGCPLVFNDCNGNPTTCIGAPSNNCSCRRHHGDEFYTWECP